jgi:site-specific recombinase XerD
LRCFFNWAVSEGFVDKTPLSNIKPKPPKEKPVEPYTPEEIKKLVTVCDYDFQNGSSFLGARNRAIILLYLASGGRLRKVAARRDQHSEITWGRSTHCCIK